MKHSNYFVKSDPTLPSPEIGGVKVVAATFMLRLQGIQSISQFKNQHLNHRRLKTCAYQRTSAQSNAG
jgi:hypothetical protein